MVLAKRFVRNRKRGFNKKRINFRKGLSLLPNLFSLGNAFFGFCSIIFAVKGELISASYFILLGALMDALDGRIARLFGVSSEIGLQLDSLADAISFCMAPALLVYFWQLKKLGFLGVFTCAFFLLCGIMRLARFNVISEKQTLFFLGLPTTIAGCFLSTLLLNFRNTYLGKPFFLTLFFLTILLSVLMVSKVRFPTFKQKLFKINRNLYVVIFVVLFAIITVMQFYQLLFVLFVLYFFSSFFYMFRIRE